MARKAIPRSGVVKRILWTKREVVWLNPRPSMEAPPSTTSPALLLSAELFTLSWSFIFNPQVPLESVSLRATFRCGHKVCPKRK